MKTFQLLSISSSLSTMINYYLTKLSLHSFDILWGNMDMGPEKETRRGFLKKAVASVGGGIAARELFKARPVRAQEDPLPPMDITEPEVQGALAEAPLSPVEKLLANTELVDAVYLGDTPVAEFRADVEEDLRLSINPEVTQENRDRFAQLTAQSGMRFGFDNLTVLLAPYNKLLEELLSQPADSKAYIFASGYNYKGKRMVTKIAGSQIIDGKCIVRVGFSDEAKANFKDPEFMHIIIADSVPATIGATLADGGLNIEDRVNRDQSILDAAQALIHDNFFQLT